MINIPYIDLKKQYKALKTEIHDRIERVLDHGQYIMGPEVAELESKLSTFTGSKHCITVGSGTDALLISLMALNIKPGDEIITTPFTFAATAEVIVLLGATPVFVDIEFDTCNINAALIESKITSKTKCIMPVSLYGQPSDMDEINRIANKYGNIPVIEDAAQSFGAIYRGKKSCNLSTIGCTSFFPSKPLGCYGDGGAIFTNDDEIAEACKKIRVHGQSERYIHSRIGIGGRMDTMQCAIVLAKLTRFDWEIDRRIHLASRYNSFFQSTKVGESPICRRPDRTSVYAQYTIVCPNRDETQLRMKNSGVPSAIHYPLPLNEQAAYKDVSGGGRTPVACGISKNVLSLPMSADLDEDEQDFICTAFVKRICLPLRE